MKQTESQAVKIVVEAARRRCNPLLLSEGRRVRPFVFLRAPRRKCLSNWTFVQHNSILWGKLLRQEALWISQSWFTQLCVGGCGNWLAVCQLSTCAAKAEQLAEREEMVAELSAAKQQLPKASTGALSASYSITKCAAAKY